MTATSEDAVFGPASPRPRRYSISDLAELFFEHAARAATADRVLYSRVRIG